MKIVFYGGRQAGMLSLLTLLALKHEIVCVIPSDEIVEGVAAQFKLTIKKPLDINERSFVEYLQKLSADLFICCHGRQILKSKLLSILPSINMHPNLYKYKGSRPVERMLEEKISKASVGIHWMTAKVDEGEVIAELFTQIKGRTPEGVYNELYPLYSKCLSRALENISQKNNL